MTIEKLNIELNYTGQTFIKMKLVNDDHCTIFVPISFNYGGQTEEEKQKSEECAISIAQEAGYKSIYLYRITFCDSDNYGLVINETKLELV
jgi:hypothetical protein